MDLGKTAKRYKDAGLNILPAWKNTKRPSTADWRCYQTEFYEGKYPTDAICAVCGEISGNLEVIDFDKKAVSYEAWRAEVLKSLPEKIFDILVIERTQSGGKHVAYRAEEIEPTQKLCMIANKEGGYDCTIETRSEGSIVLIAPSDGYEVESGSWENVPYLEKEVRDILINAARALTEQTIVPSFRDAPVEFKDMHKETLGEDVAIFLREDDASKKLLQKHGWTYVCDYQGNKELWRRPGKTTGVSATLDKETGLVYCWTSNAYPLVNNTTYTPLQLLAELEYNGDESEASRDVIRDCRQDDDPIYTCPFTIRSSEEIKVYDSEPVVKTEQKYKSIYEVPFPKSCLNPGGFLEAMMDYIDSISMREQRRLGFAASITALGHILSRRLVYKYSNLSPALYTIGICPPSSGKSSARRALQTLFNFDATGISSTEVVESIESVQALQSAIQQYKKVFLMQDEFGAWLTATMIEASNGNKRRIIDEILKLYSETCNPHYVSRITAGSFKNDNTSVPVEYPGFSLYGVTNLLEFQTAMNERLLENGFVARVLFVAGNDQSAIKLSDYDTMVKGGKVECPNAIKKFFENLLKFRPTDPINHRIPELFPVDITREAYGIIREYSLECDKEYLNINETETFDLKIFKGRAFEKAMKYALNFAVSKFGVDEDKLIIDDDVIRQAIDLSRYEYEFYSYLARNEIAETETIREIKKVEKWLRSLKEDTFSKGKFTSRFQRLNIQMRMEILKTLEDKGVLSLERVVASDGKKKPTTLYHVNREKL